MLNASFSAKDTADHKKEIRESVKKREDFRPNGFLPTQFYSPSFCASASGSSQVRKSCSRGSSREDKFAKRRHLVIEVIHPTFEPFNVLRTYAGSPWNAEISTEIEQQLLDFLEAVRVLVISGGTQNKTNSGIELIKLTQQFDPR
jgi:hypothetical protein